MQLGLAGGQAGGEHGESHLLDGADHALLAQQPPHRPLTGHAVGRRTYRRHQVGMPVGGGQHGACLGQVSRHPRLTEHMLAGVERRNGDTRVHVGRGADPDDVDLRVVHDLAPVVDNPRDAVFLGEGLRRLAAPVADGDDVDSRNRLKSGHVPLAHDAAGAHDPDSHHV